VRPRLIGRLGRDWPTQWRLALTSAGLTLAILVAFALIVGRLATHRLHTDFAKETRGTARSLALESQVSYAYGSIVVRRPNLATITGPGRGIVRIVTSRAEVLSQTPGAPNLGPPRSLARIGELQVASAQIPTSPLGPAVYIQYARDTESMEATSHRIWLFLGLGVLGATALAALAGLVVAQRAMLRSLDASRTETQRAMKRQREFVADAAASTRRRRSTPPCARRGGCAASSATC
jgi:hypothetical protein